jgi:hypothetical protein
MNYTSTARSNYFRVKDEAAFRLWAQQRHLYVSQAQVEGQPLFMIEPMSDENGWPSYWYDREADEEHDCDIPEELAAFLDAGDVGVLLEVGNEGSRYVAGTAVAVNAQGGQRRVSLDDIYEKAADLGPRVTKAE